METKKSSTTLDREREG